MASVPLVFNLPAEEGLTALKIYESTSADGPWTLIETVTAIGTYPDYIHEYSTDNATSAENWFSISTVDQAAVESDLSVPMKGGTQTVVNMVTERVMQRGTMLDESVVIQEAEAVIEQYFGQDPYTVDPAKVSYSVLTGLTYLTLARTFVVEQVQATSGGGAADSWTAGLVSMKSGTNATQSSQVSFDWLMKQAASLLGIGTSRVAQMAIPENAYSCAGLSKLINYDISRLEITMGVE
jgi:hypothetical protein